LFLGFVAAGLLPAPLVSAYSTGITGVARPAQGCTCHGMAGTTSNKTTEVSVVGLPDAYVPSTTYHLQAWVRGIALPAPRFAGFDLEATAGTLHALDSSAWVSGLDGQATHSAPKSVGFVGPTGLGSSWDIDWVAPNPGAGPVTFYLAGNVVNGIGVQTNADQGDIWSVADPGFVVAEGQAGVTTTTTPPPTTTTTISTVTTTTLAPAVDSWPRRFFDAQPPTAPRLLLRIATHTAGPIGSALGTYAGVQSTPNLALVTNPNTGLDEQRLYFGVNRVDKTLWCLNVDKIVADRSATPSGA